VAGRRRAGQAGRASPSAPSGPNTTTSQTGRDRRRPARANVALIVLLALGGVLLGGYTLHRFDPASASCARPLTLRIAADPTVAAPLTTIAADYNRSATTVDGKCVAVRVSAQASATTLAALSKQTGPNGETTQSVQTAPTAATPDVWIPESTSWLELAGTNPAAATIVPRRAPAIASSPLVVAMPTPMATALGPAASHLTWAELNQDRYSTTFWSSRGHPDWGPFRFGFALPSSSAASQQALLTMAAVNGKTEPAAFTIDSFTGDRAVQLSVLGAERSAAAVPDTSAALLSGLRARDDAGAGLSYLSAAPMLESQLIAYDRGQGAARPPSTPLTASYPSDGLYLMPVPYAVTNGTANDPDRARAAASFLARVSSVAGRATLNAAGLRSPDGTGVGSATPGADGVPAQLPAHRAPDVRGGVIDAADTFFAHVHQRGSTLAVFDVSGSMATVVAGTSPSATRLEVAVAGATTGLALFAPEDQVGLWEFSTNLGQGQDYKQLTPVEALDAPSRLGLSSHLDDLRQLSQSMRPRADTALYETALAAFDAKNAAWTPGRLNQVVLLTDGANDDPGHPDGLTLAGLLAAIHQRFNPAKPTRIITIAYGEDADPGPLQQISAATGARSYVSRDPNDILNVFIDAVTQGT
jgi:Ca-activated chloride channel family protein